jgi:quinol monooxygenase YgiN
MRDVVVVAEIGFEPGREDEGMERLRTLLETTHEGDDGCLLYALHTLADDPSKVVFVEKWSSKEKLDEHLGTSHIADFAGFDGIAGEPRILVLDPVVYGDPEKGAV